jgi:tryptophanase
MDYVVEALTQLRKDASKLRGVRFSYKPEVLRHFTARFEWA